MPTPSLYALLLFLLPHVADTAPKLAPIYPTPQAIVDRMLELGHLRAGEKMCDLGSGDGRIVIKAAQKFLADASGIEIDDKLYRLSLSRIRELGLSKSPRVIPGHIL